MMRRPLSLPAFFMPVTRRLRTIGLLLPALAGLALLAGGVGFRVSEGMGLAALQETGHHRLDLYAGSLEREIDKYAYFPATLGLERDVLDLVSGRAPLAWGLNRYLERLNERAGTLSIYVLNRQGRVLAASNWNRPDSFIGEDLSYRPYFVEAAAGRQGRFFGVGTTRGEAGYYLSAPLSEDGAIVGVAVVKVSLEQLEQGWSTVEAPVLVTDENGVVILASVPSWKFTTLRPMDEPTRRHFDQTLQYNARPLPPLGLTPVSRIAEDAELVRLPRPPGGQLEETVFPVSGGFLAQTAPLHGTGWTMTVLSPVAQVTGMAWTRAALAAVGSAFLGILLLMWMQRRRHLHDLERKVEERTRTLRAAQDELVHAGKLAVIGQLSAGLAHELNQPLAALRTLSGNSVKFLQRGNLEAAQGNLERIAALVDAMGALTSQLKSFARKSSGAPRPVAVRRPIDNALFLLDQRLRRSGVAVHLDVPEEVTALCDPNRLEQVLVNLVANGLDALAGREDGRLALTARTEDGRVRIDVADNGPGLSADVLPRLFEPFFTTKEGAKEGGGGLGLGLAISAGIVRDFGGALTGANGPDGGAVFTIDLPAATPPTDPSATLAAVQAGDLICPTLPSPP
ncbi:two-component system, NtrC family, C4-dicarboxylate transport sensor histidine kinase DctB [Azospirillum oryzae]|uniref:C4-dicarboxylate transport sensor protein DctB n=2 Tax=Azospirillum oryzae TaxID=286727 RepID=A0A1X7DNS0_9PROT|nr:two-component system, NtrC family, C4-dicarboxylate transport sensor histidine kinase DctB [Azospirillum oryzae]